MGEKTTKHVIMIIPGALLLYILIPIGDFCTGGGSAIAWILLSLTLIFFFLLILITNLSRVIQKKEKFDFGALLLFVFFFGGSCWISKLDNPKFWTKEFMTARYNRYRSDNLPNGIYLTLYTNNSFAIRQTHFKNSCTKQGKYRISNDTLYLEHPDLLADKTDSVAARYVIDRRKSVLVAVDYEFPQLTIIKSLP